MFGLILPSRPVLTPASLQTISPTQFAYTFPSSPSFSHIVVFLLSGNELPPDAAAAVYVQLPRRPAFQLLGALTAAKQSAIFQVRTPHPVNGLSNGTPSGLNNSISGGIPEVDMDADVPAPNTTNDVPGDVIVGISIEPLASIAAQLASLNADAEGNSTALTLVKRPPSTKVLAQRIIRDAFNFLASFAGQEGGKEVVPLKSFREWWAKFERRVESDPGFLEREGDG
ncbi:hypothetical protein MMC13_000993 [Lambiella insularis]|nr:hypothetical protein [Lambiella insularis]